MCWLAVTDVADKPVIISDWGLRPHAQTLWLDELAVGADRPPAKGK
jgi:hypothetical protein